MAVHRRLDQRRACRCAVASFRSLPSDLHELRPVARAFIDLQDIADSRSIKFVLNHVRLQRTSLSRFQTVRQSACWNDDGFI